MANLSYCRFQNTARDLSDCVEAIDNHEIDIETISDSLLILAREVLDRETEIESIIENT